MTLWKRLLILPPVIAGIAVVYWAVSNQSRPEVSDIAERQVPIAYIEARPQRFVPRVSGFGTVRPARTWDAVAQVRGRIVHVHPNFVRGGAIRAGEDVVRIASDEYELAVAQAEANILSAAAQIEELDVNAEATRASLEIEQQALDLAERELERQQELAERGQLAASAVEAQERAVLSQRAAVQSLENQLKLIPAQRGALEQSLAVSRAALDQAELDLERTSVPAPFDGRVATADVDISEFVSAGSRMGTLDGVASVEIDAQMAPQQMAQLSRLVFPDTESGIDDLTEMTNEILTARVRLGVEGFDPEWPADVARITDGVDPQTRSIGVIVTVADPYALVRAGERPPLIKGMFVEVDLAGPAVDGVTLLPRAAIDDGRVMVVDEAGRLGFAEVDVVFTEDSLAVVSAASLQPGTRVIVSEPSPAIPGMLLTPRHDTETEARLAEAAAPPADAEDDGVGAEE